MTTNTQEYSNKTYETNVVLTYTKTLPENRHLSLKQIASKLAHLCFKPHIVYSNEGCNIYLDELEKYDTQGGKCNTITNKCLPGDNKF